MPKGSMSTHDLIKIGKKEGINIFITDIQTKLKRIRNGLEPAPKGLATDIIDSKHRLIVPKEMAQQILEEARERKNLPMLLKSGTIMPLSKLSLELGFSKRFLHGNKGIKSFRIGQGRYISEAEAKKVRKFYRKGRQSRLAKKAKKPGNVAEKKPKIDSAETLAKNWLKQNRAYANNGQIMLFERVVNQSKGLSRKQFEKKILPLLEKIFYR